MRVLSVNISQLIRVPHKGEEFETGIFKRPVESVAVSVTVEGLAGDAQADRKHHGGKDKAVYVYSHENQLYWAGVRGESAYPHGHFGENLSVSGMTDDVAHIGDIFAVGSTVVMQVTQPRVPCYKLGIVFGDPAFVGEFLVSGRTGFYLRVLETGSVRRGDDIRRVSSDPLAVTVRDAMQALMKGPQQQECIRRVLAVEGLSEAWRHDLSNRLEVTGGS
jgi:MOSC domain-containing protein YiiM